MKKVIIGHRGVGKSEFLFRHQQYLKKNNIDVMHFDLDLEIEKKSRTTIQKIFSDSGESHFRDLEKKIFNDITTSHPEFVIALGAGFNLELIPNDFEVLFVTRPTDEMGRVFLNRPRLNLAVSSVKEYQDRYLQRQKSYLSKATQIYYMSEGLESLNPLEAKIINNQNVIENAIYTLVDKEISLIQDLKITYKCIELRTDLLSEQQIKSLVTSDPDFNWIISIRTENTQFNFRNIIFDYDSQLKSITAEFVGEKKNIISSHIDSVQDAILALSDFQNLHKKLSPLVENFADLWVGHRWQQEDPKNRSFLPRSMNGKWLWYRQYAKFTQKLNFIRNFTNLKDQPSAYQWLVLPKKKPSYFGAVLGQPIYFSRSPETHTEFFLKKKSFFTAIDISESEFFEFQSWLIELGLKFAAVTSPLKKKAFELSNRRSDLVERFHSANTLVYLPDQIYSQNTDQKGFKTLIDSAKLLRSDKVAVWGGGGTLDMMRSLLPQAFYFSSQTATLRDHELIEDDGFKPDILIWSTPRSDGTKWPVTTWQPRLVIDLNYQENSMGLEYAQKINCQYLSGLGMFKAQALEQQHYWSQI